MGCGASHERPAPMAGRAGLVPIVPTAASTPAAASEKAENAAAEKAAAERAAAEKAAAEKAAVEKAPAEFERQLAKARAAQKANTNAAASGSSSS